MATELLIFGKMPLNGKKDETNALHIFHVFWGKISFAVTASTGNQGKPDFFSNTSDISCRYIYLMCTVYFYRDICCFYNFSKSDIKEIL